MRKRVFCLVLTAIMIICNVLAGMPAVLAASAMTTSDSAVALLKQMEGFSSKPYWDYAQWTVGYGTRCPDDKLNEYTANGIPEAEAEALLRGFLFQFESEVNSFVDRTCISLNQNQFDALLMFTYNCGSAWAYQTTGVLYKAIVGRAVGNDLINAFARWCYAGGALNTSLLRRRLCEANMYLNAGYSQTPPEDFGYVLYDANGGTCDPKLQGYNTTLTASIEVTPTFSGYSFDGWYTARQGGSRVTVLDASVKNQRLYAHWIDNQGQDPTQGSVDGVLITMTGTDVNIRQGAGTNYASIGKAQKGEQYIVTETTEATGYKWGKCYVGSVFVGWICLDYTNYSTVVNTPEPTVSDVVTGTVRVNDYLNVREGPGTNYKVNGSFTNGTRVTILERRSVGSVVWGRTDNGWISLDYVTMDPEPEPTTPEPTTPEPTTPTDPAPAEPPASTARTGTIKVNEFLRIRSVPSLNGSIVGYLSPNQRVSVFEQALGSGMTWGKIDEGWICMDYVQLDSEPTGSRAFSGTVKLNDYLRVRTSPGTTNSICGYLPSGYRVTVTETKMVGNTEWGKIDKGWICLDYVVPDGQAAASSSVTSMTVIADCLRIRRNAGTANAVVGYLYYGQTVKILETTDVGGTAWGRVSQGWISMDYVK